MLSSTRPRISSEPPVYWPAMLIAVSWVGRGPWLLLMLLRHGSVYEVDARPQKSEAMRQMVDQVNSYSNGVNWIVASICALCFAGAVYGTVRMFSFPRLQKFGVIYSVLLLGFLIWAIVASGSPMPVAP